MPPADYPFALRYENINLVPWRRFDKIIAFGGIRLCSLAGECARHYGIPAFLVCPQSRITAFQAPDGALITLSNQKLSPAFEDLTASLPSIGPEDFNNPSRIAPSGLPRRQEEFYRTGARCDLVSVACSEDTSSVSSSEAMALDIRALAERIHQSGEASLQRVSNLFAEFRWREKRLMIYRQGRLSLSPCEDAEEVFFAYQFFLNS